MKGKPAKELYLFLTGPQVDAEGAAGHLYKRGQNVVCKYVNADADDDNGKPMPQQDPRRYSCVMYLDRNGVVKVSQSV